MAVSASNANVLMYQNTYHDKLRNSLTTTKENSPRNL